MDTRCHLRPRAVSAPGSDNEGHLKPATSSESTAEVTPGTGGGTDVRRLELGATLEVPAGSEEEHQ